MAIAVLVLGIVSLKLSIVPVFGSICCIPAIVAIILGMIDLLKQINHKGGTKLRAGKAFDIIGIVFGGVALIVMVVQILFWMISILGRSSHDTHNRFSYPSYYVEQDDNTDCNYDNPYHNHM